MYAERRIAPGADLWTSNGPAGEQRILPDGCLDLILDGDRVVVAGPDSTARVHTSSSSRTLWAARLHAGLGPTLLGVPADELGDTTVPLAALWGDGRARAFGAELARDPVVAFTERVRRIEADPFGARLRSLLASGRSVSQAAERLGWSTRQLGRRTIPVFGYGPQHLARVLRLGRAVSAADRGLRWAEVAVVAGYSDQAHLSRDVRALSGLTPTRLRAERVRSVQDAG